MATKIETLKKPNGDQVLPRTHAKAVSMENGMTVDVAIEDITEQLKTCPDANSVVLHTQQELTETQKSQARTNIGITEWLTSEDVVADSPTPIDADTLGGHSVNYYTSLIDKLDARINYLEAICSDNMVYYNTLNKAVNDVNAGTIGANADANKNTAVAGVYTDKDGGKNVVLLKDTNEATRVSPSVDMTINLGGHVLSADDTYCIDVCAGNLVVDGRLPGSAIKMFTSSTSMSYCIMVRGASSAESVTVNGGNYFMSSDGTSVAIRNNKENTKLVVSNCDIEVSNSSGRGVGIFNAGVAIISGCDITASAIGNSAESHAITNGGEATISNCDIRAYSNYHKDGDGYSASSRGVFNSGTLTINDCYVLGTHSGMENHGTLYVNGGTYESYGHGGIYFADTGTTAYVRNATLKDSLTMPEGYTGTSQHNGAGFYIGGGDNMKVYMDNCKIYGSASQIVLRGSSNEKNNTLKISNSDLYDLDGDYLSVRIDNDTHKLYIGKGCNFTAENTTLPSAVIATDEVYVQAA
jgi:hypothetical protein